MMKALKFRASQLERATVELSKKSVEEDKLTREKAVREKIEREATEKTQLEAEELAKQKAAKEKSERETAEKATREKAEREAAEKVTQEKNKKEVEREFEKSIKKAKRDLRWKKFKTNIRYRLQLIWIYRVPILILLVTFGLIVPLLIRLSNLIPKITSEFNNTPTATIGLSLVPQQNLTSTEAFIPTEIFTPSSIPTENFTPAPLLTEIADDEDVPMVLVSEGEFIAGSVGVERKVYLDTFYIDKYEVTNFQYSKCVLNGKCRTPADSKLGDYDYYGNPQYDNFPVVWVNSEMAQDYCEWREARLPSVLEWEKAARGTDGRLYPWGNDLDNVKRANSYSSTDGYQITSPVGSFPEGVSPYGVYDMAGNVAEWTSDQISIGSTWRYGDEFMFDSQDYLASGGSDPDEGFRCARDSYP
jgi:formylglycine-generating enzyme required for sulfatase activity